MSKRDDRITRETLALLIVYAMLIVLVVACETPRRITPPPQVEARPQEQVVPVAATPAVPEGERVRVPEHAQWLGEQIDAAYRDVPARLALERIVPAPIHFALHEPFMPLVQALPGSRPRQDHLDAICAQADWAWRLDADGQVQVTDRETRSFMVHAAPGRGEGTLTAAKGDADSGGTMRQHVEIEPAVELHQALSDLFVAENDDTAKVVLLPATGELVVTARPSLMRRIATVVDGYNDRLTRRVLLDFTLFEVDVSDTDTRELDVRALGDQAINAGFNFGAGPREDFGAGTGELSFRFAGTRNIDGAQILFRWLSEQGDTQIAVRKRVTALHNQVTSLRDVLETRYVGEVTIQRQVGGATETISPSIQVEDLVTGETWAVLPTITEDQVHVRLALSRAELLGFSTYDFAATISGTLPQSTSKTVGLPITLADGETRVITDLASEREQANATSTPLLAWLPWLGESRRNDTRRIQTVVSLTAHILD